MPWSCDAYRCPSIAMRAGSLHDVTSGLCGDGECQVDISEMTSCSTAKRGSLRPGIYRDDQCTTPPSLLSPEALAWIL